MRAISVCTFEDRLIYTNAVRQLHLENTEENEIHLQVTFLMAASMEEVGNA